MKKLLIATMLFGMMSSCEEPTTTTKSTQHRVKIGVDVKELKVAIDSIQKENDLIRSTIFSNFKPYFLYALKSQPPVKIDKFKKIELNKLDKNQRIKALGYAVNSARSVQSFTKTYKERVDMIIKEVNNFDIERVRKYSQSLAIIIMFLIGAPLGAIIKKGGLGLPILISVFFFVIYYINHLRAEICKR